MDRKIAIITGGSRGLGAAAAVKLAARGVDSIITYRTDIFISRAGLRRERTNWRNQRAILSPRTVYPDESSCQRCQRAPLLHFCSGLLSSIMEIENPAETEPAWYCSGGLAGSVGGVRVVRNNNKEGRGV